jgi:NitT/TauT family transport system substrate-binding protein
MLRRRSLLAPVVLLALLLSACGSAADTPHNITIGLTYVPNIQFAPVYAAQSLGYYHDAGLNVTLRHHTFAEDEFGAFAAGQENMIYVAGDEVVQARSKNIPVTYVAPIYTQYPVALMVPSDSSIQTAADLRGHTIGIPGQYGATYIGLLVLLQQAGLTPNDVHIQSIGYTQVSALQGHKVDAVMGYVNNEAVQFQLNHFAIRTISVFSGSAQPFISIGLGASQAEMKNHPDDVKHFIAATMRGVAYVKAHPQDSVRLSKQFVPDLSDSAQSATALAVLQASIPLWQDAGKPTDAGVWQTMTQFMQSHGLITSPVNAADCFSNGYL